MWDCLLDALLDTLKVLPVVFLVYLLVSYFGHNQTKYVKLLKGTKRYGPFIGAVTGSIPQCGFSVVMSDLYSKKAISVGTLIAVFLATSDEAIPIMLSHPGFIVPLLILILIKFVYATICGFVIDLIVNFKKNKSINIEAVKAEFSENTHPCDCGHIHTDEIKIEKESNIKANLNLNNQKMQHEIKHNHENCEHEHHHEQEEHCCADNIFLDALKHTAKILLFLFIATAIINILIFYIGEDAISKLFGINIILQVLLAGLVGLIPNCASSVVLVEFYISGIIGFGPLLAGLSVGAGVGYLVLFVKNKKHMGKNFLIVLTTYILGVMLGLAFSFINLGF